MTWYFRPLGVVFISLPVPLVAPAAGAGAFVVALLSVLDWVDFSQPTRNRAAARVAESRAIIVQVSGRRRWQRGAEFPQLASKVKPPRTFGAVLGESSFCKGPTIVFSPLTPAPVSSPFKTVAALCERRTKVHILARCGGHRPPLQSD